MFSLQSVYKTFTDTTKFGLYMNLSYS